MNALIAENVSVNPYTIDDMDVWCELWAATEWIINKNTLKA